MFADSLQVKRDIQWILGEPNLLELPPIHKIPDDFWTSISFNSYPEYEGSERIGFYYQWLIRLCIEHSKSYQLVAEEIQVFQDGRTLGAIDFIVRNPAGELEHWEVAVKFYLAYEDQWYGPNAKDSLAKKYHKMCSHQLAITRTEAFQIQHPDLTIAHHRLLLQGRLYQGLWCDEQNDSTPANITNHCCTGKWCNAGQLPDMPALYPLQRIQWMTAPAQDLCSPLDIQSIKRPLHCIDDSGQFWFVVPDSWPDSD